MKPATLDCQNCGAEVRRLTSTEAQMVAANPYNYVVYCAFCQREGAWKVDARKMGLL